MRPPLHALTSLRFFAAAAVFFSHLGFLQSSSSDELRWAYLRVFSEGYVGVTFFFILSGFILSYSYEERSRANRLDFIDFMSARIARIYPLHWITLLLAIPISLATALKFTPISNQIDIFVMNASLTQAFSISQETYFSFNAPSWSLSVEMFFYLLFPLLLRFKSWHLVSIATAILAAKYLTDRGMGSTPIHYVMYVAPTLRLPDFIMGLLIFRIFARSTSLSVATATGLQILSLLVLAVAFYLRDLVGQDYRYDIYYMLPMGLIVFAFAYQNGLGARAISGRVLVILGEASFALYLIHQLVIRHGELFRLDVAGMTGPNNEILFMLAYASISIALSYGLFRWFEMPAKEKTLETLRAMRNLSRRAAASQ